jgi:CoA-transferase family III
LYERTLGDVPDLVATDAVIPAMAPRPAMARLMALTGRADGPPLAPPDGVVPALDALVGALARRSPVVGKAVDLDWGAVVCGRADLLGLTRQGRRSANGSCRLLRTADDWVAVNLPRPDDLDAVGALIGIACDDPWAALERAAPHVRAADLVAQGRLLGMPVAPLPPARRVAGPGRHEGAEDPPARPAPPSAGWPARGAGPGWSRRGLWPPGERTSLTGALVVDCSPMWAGPLAAMVLDACGASVVKVESTTRPDAARRTPAFYRSLHPAGQQEVVLDVASPSGLRTLRELVEGADVVIESSRPRAFEQLGVGPLQLAPRAGRVWLSITGYGRDSPGRDWVAFGDDAAVAGGLVAWEEGGEPVFCGDAMADPVTGLVGALAVIEAVSAGGGTLLDVAMSRCAASLVSVPVLAREPSSAAH